MRNSPSGLLRWNGADADEKLAETHNVVAAEPPRACVAGHPSPVEVVIGDVAEFRHS
jgi:hypothetical protein